MIDAQGAVFHWLTQDDDVLQYVDEYQGGPAIFLGRIPGDHEIGIAPCIIVDAASAPVNEFTFDAYTRSEEVNIRIYGDVLWGGPVRNEDTIHTVAELVWKRFRDAAWTFQTTKVSASTASAPVDAPTDRDANAGRLVTARLRLEEIQ